MFVDARADGAVTARRAIEELLDRIADDAVELGATAALERIEAIAREGTAADRQLALSRHGASLQEVVESLARETAARP